MIGLVTDSSAQMPPELVRRYAVEVVPVTVQIDDVEYAEGVDLDADEFYRMCVEGSPTITTSQPSPGRFLDAYERLAERGCTDILSVHVGSAYSGTANSARVAAAATPVRVEVVDTGTASFGVGCCVWEAAEALAGGASLDGAVEVATRLVDSLGTVFVLQAADVARAGGRFGIDLPDEGVPVVAIRNGGDLEVVAMGTDVAQLSAAMVDVMHAGGRPIRVALGIADPSARPFWEAMETALAGRDDVREIVRYRVGPSIAAHTGRGTAGGFWYPIP